MRLLISVFILALRRIVVKYRILFQLLTDALLQFLNRQLRVASRACTRGVTMNLDGTTTLEPTEFQQRWTQEHWMLQYDLMFGKGYALTRMGLESVAEPAKGK